MNRLFKYCASLFKNIIYRMINGKHSLYAQYQNIEHISTLDFKETMLITSIDMSEGHFFEGLIARKFAFNGIKPYAFCCKQELEFCEHINFYSSLPEVRCAICMAEQNVFLKTFQLESFSYKDFITKADYIEIDTFIYQYFNNSPQNHYFRNTEINSILFSALQRYYLLARPETKEDKVGKGFLKTILLTIISTEKIVKALSPEIVLSSHGFYSTWGAAVEYCKHNAIDVATWGRSYNNNGIQFAFGDSYLNHDFVTSSSDWESIQVTPSIEDTVSTFYQGRLGGKDTNQPYDYNRGNKTILSHDQLCEKLEIPKNSKIVGMFPNIPWDGQVFGDSDLFDSFEEWLQFNIENVTKNDDVYLVLRSHPAEELYGTNVGKETTSSMVKLLFPVLHEKLIVLPPDSDINSHTIGQNSIFSIIYSSTIGLELSYLKIPVILGGNPPFKGKNILFEAINKNEYKELLTRGIGQELSVTLDNISNFYKFTHFYYFQQIMPETLIVFNNESPVSLNFSSEKELNDNECLEYLYTSMLNKHELNFMPFYPAKSDK